MNAKTSILAAILAVTCVSAGLSETRKWSSGGFAAEGELLTVHRGTATIRLQSGYVVRIATVKLSRRDQAYIRFWIRGGEMGPQDPAAAQERAQLEYERKESAAERTRKTRSSILSRWRAIRAARLQQQEALARSWYPYMTSLYRVRW